MPIYSFICRDCEYVFDEIVGHDEVTNTRCCQRCGGGTAYRMPSVPAPAMGSFGTVRRDTTKQGVQKMNFAKRGEQLEFPFGKESGNE